MTRFGKILSLAAVGCGVCCALPFVAPVLAASSLAVLGVDLCNWRTDLMLFGGVGLAAAGGLGLRWGWRRRAEVCGCAPSEAS